MTTVVVSCLHGLLSFDNKNSFALLNNEFGTFTQLYSALRYFTDAGVKECNFDGVLIAMGSKKETDWNKRFDAIFGRNQGSAFLKIEN